MCRAPSSLQSLLCFSSFHPTQLLQYTLILSCALKALKPRPSKTIMPTCGCSSGLQPQLNLSIQVKWVKAHGLERPEFISKFAVSSHQLLGNALADKLAGRAADAAAIDPDIASRILSLYAETQAIHRRVVSILGTLIRDRPMGPPLRHPQPDHLPLSFYASFLCTL